MSSAELSSVTERAFTNPIGEGADPQVVSLGDRYLWCQSEGNVGVAIWESPTLTSLGRKHVVWRAPATGPWSKQVWAPELIRLDGRWYIYVAASAGDNASHRAYVLAADSDDPIGPYTVHGPLRTADPADAGSADWAIDMTVLEQAGRRYAIWSGWPRPWDRVQHLYLAELASPTSITGPRLQLFSPSDYPWERIRNLPGASGLNEAPQVLQRGQRTFVVYSCGSALLPTYKLGLLELTGDDPLDIGCWRKYPEPVFESSGSTFGVGHDGFALSPDGSQWWHVYHAKVDRRRSFRRGIFVQPMRWRADGLPDFGTPVARGEPLVEPAGTVHNPSTGARHWAFADSDVALEDFDYYGHHQMVETGGEGLHLGVVPAEPVNDYRSGEKVVLRDGDYTDLELETAFRIVSGDRAVGALFRAMRPAVGYDAQQAYFAGVVPRRRRLLLAKTDGRSYVELAAEPIEIEPGAAVTLSVRARGPHLEARVDTSPASRSTPSPVPLAVVSAEDADRTAGSIGLRVVDTHAVFRTLAVTPPP